MFRNHTACMGGAGQTRVRRSFSLGQSMSLLHTQPRRGSCACSAAPACMAFKQRTALPLSTERRPGVCRDAEGALQQVCTGFRYFCCRPPIRASFAARCGGGVSFVLQTVPTDCSWVLPLALQGHLRLGGHAFVSAGCCLWKSVAKPRPGTKAAAEQ